MLFEKKNQSCQTLQDIPTLRHVYLKNIISAPRNHPQTIVNISMNSEYFQGEYII
jgi:hypothetical protein